MAELRRWPDVMLDIVEEHLEELDFLWELRERVVFAEDWDLSELAEHEDRCEAHLDGLRIVEGHAVDVALPALVGEERGAATAATMVLLSFGKPDLDQEVVRALTGAGAEAREGISAGLRHSEVGRLLQELRRLAAEADPETRIAALDVLAFHRTAPPPDLAGTIRAIDPGLRPRLYPALGRFGGPWTIEDLRRSLDSDAPPDQRAALSASARVGLRGLRNACRDASSRRDPASPTALEFLGVVGDAEDLVLLERSLGDSTLAPAALAALGAMGGVRAVPLLLDAMRDDVLSAGAGAAFRRLTGAPDIDADEPLPAPEGLSEDDIDILEPVVPADPDRASAWWAEHGSRFHEEGFWQAGRDLSQDPLGDAFQALPLAARRDVYLRRRHAEPDVTPDLELEARARAQLERDA